MSLFGLTLAVESTVITDRIAEFPVFPDLSLSLICPLALPSVDFFFGSHYF